MALAKKIGKKLREKMFTKWRPLILSRHPSHQGLREKGALGYFPFRSVVRLGSTTVTTPDRIECNSIEGVRNSASKLRMKQKFTEAGVKTAEWFKYISPGNYFENQISGVGIRNEDLPYPIIAKYIYGSRGTGNYKLDTQQDLERWMVEKDLSNYIFEKYFYPGQRTAEYRIHCTLEGAFYSCRKMIKNDIPENKRWQRHSDNCVWIKEDSESGLFDKPNNWEVIVQECVKALNSLNLDLACFDIKVQAKRKQNGEERMNPDFIIIESNSAASLMEIGLEKYKEIIPKILKRKYEQLQH